MRANIQEAAAKDNSTAPVPEVRRKPVVAHNGEGTSQKVLKRAAKEDVIFEEHPGTKIDVPGLKGKRIGVRFWIGISGVGE